MLKYPLLPRSVNMQRVETVKQSGPCIGVDILVGAKDRDYLGWPSLGLSHFGTEKYILRIQIYSTNQPTWRLWNSQDHEAGCDVFSLVAGEFTLVVKLGLIKLYI